MTLFFPIPFASRLMAPTMLPATGALRSKFARSDRCGYAVGSILLGTTMPKAEPAALRFEKTRFPLAPAQSGLLSIPRFGSAEGAMIRTAAQLCALDGRGRSDLPKEARATGEPSADGRH